MMTFKQFQALRTQVTNQEKFIDDGQSEGQAFLYNIDPCDEHKRGGMCTLCTLVSVGTDGEGEHCMTLNRGDFTASGDSGLHKLERMLYDWCASENLLG